MGINLSNFYKHKESNNHIVYLEKECKNIKLRQMIVYYKAKNMYMQCILDETLLDLLFNPIKFKNEHMKEKQR